MTATPAPQSAATVALWMATHLGWHVLPLNPGTKRPLAGCPTCRGGGDHQAAECPCLRRGNGALCHGVWAASNNPDIVTAWARRWHAGVWGVHLGVSGLLCVDLDTHSSTPPAHPLNGIAWPANSPAPIDGLDTFAALAGMHDAALDTGTTLATATPSGGLHLVYAAQAGRWKGSTAHLRDDRVTSGLGWQIDVKAHGGYVVIPGSTTDTGTYHRISPTVIPDRLPAWLTGELVRTGHDRHATTAPTDGPAPLASAVTPEAGRPQRFADAALRSACAELAAMAPDTGRNRKLFRSASRLAGMVAAGWIDRGHVETALTAAALHAALPGGEIRYALASGFRNPRPAHLRSAA